MFSLLICAALPYIVTDLLPSQDKVELKNQEFSVIVEKNLSDFVSLSKEKQYDAAYDAWQNACLQLFNLECLYFQTLTLSPNIVLQGLMGNNLLKIQTLFTNYIKNPAILATFIDNALNASYLTPYQRYVTKNILKGQLNPNEPSLTKLQNYVTQNFAYKEINQRKTPFLNKQITVLTANILCFPNPFSYFFGGASPWEERIEGITKKILSTKANIICLQEVFDPQVASILIENLKKKYNYFIYDIGPQNTSLNPKEIGLNTGLFIASQIPFDTIEFIPFARKIPANSGLQRGALKAEFTLNKSQWTLIATHLQSGTESKQAEIRLEQFAHCKELLGDQQGFIIGDLNINAFSKEFQKSLLATDFIIPYLKGKSETTQENATATDYFNDLTHTPPADRSSLNPSYSLCDYCIFPKAHTPKKMLTQKRIPLFSIKEPSKALSDHHALITTWKVSS